MIDAKVKTCGRSKKPRKHSAVFQKRLCGNKSGSGWPEFPIFVLSSDNDKTLQFPCRRDKILLRDCYFEAYCIAVARLEGKNHNSPTGMSNEDATTGVLLTGNPGIGRFHLRCVLFQTLLGGDNTNLLSLCFLGKSVFLSFCLVLRLLLALPTAFQLDGDTSVLLLTGQGSYDIISAKSRTILDEDPSVIALCDSEPAGQLMGGRCYRSWPILYASSPNPNLYKRFKKKCSSYTIYMDIWLLRDLNILK